MSRTFYDSPYVFLVTEPALSRLIQQSDAYRKCVDQIIKGPEPVFRYPDGSLQIEGGGAVQLFFATRLQGGMEGVEFNTIFRSLAPFSMKQFRFWYEASYRRKLGKYDFRVIPSPPIPESPGEHELGSLPVTVAFLRKPKPDVMRKFTDVISQWCRSVATSGMFGEGPIATPTPELIFQGARVQFVIDASGSGQNTLNWLVLTAYNFGRTVATVAGIHFDMKVHPDFPDKNYIDAYWGPAEGEITVLPIAPTSASGSDQSITPPDSKG